ncbi:sigma factor [Nocardioides sp. Soil774]|uniref:sigma factor n=1 Tax=Nocardioides sp. Soil774 TaxID=1736408 RepID=UPI00138F0FA5|nr:sigma factor [Nocardioides sp. Soil774]
MDAFADLYDHLAPRVFGLVTSVVHDVAVAEAVACEAFVDVWRRSATFDRTCSSAAAWVLAVAHRLAVRARRQVVTTCACPALPAARDSMLARSGLSAVQVDAVRLAYFSGLDHRRVDAALAGDQPAAALLTDALRFLSASSPSR